MTDLERAEWEAEQAEATADRAVRHAMDDRNEWSAWLARKALGVAERKRAIASRLRAEADERTDERQVRLPYAEAS